MSGSKRDRCGGGYHSTLPPTAFITPWTAMKDPSEMPLLEAAEIRVVLIVAAQPRSALLVRAAPEDVPGPVRFVVVVNYGLWEVTIWRRVGWLERTLSVRAPDDRSWLRGCQRDWEGSGSIIDPLDGLSSQQRVALEHRLVLAAEMPEQDFPVDQAQTILQAPYQPHQPKYKRNSGDSN